MVEVPVFGPHELFGPSSAARLVGVPQAVGSLRGVVTDLFGVVPWPTSLFA